MKRNYTIDLIKFILALFIVALHSNPLVEYNALISYFLSQVLSRIGVPFFAAIAGYYFFKNFSHEKYKNTMIRYIETYTIWSIIYFLYEELVLLSGGSLLSINSVLTMYFTGFYHLWYMLAIIYTLFIVCVVNKIKNGLQTLYVASFIFLILGIMMFGYGKLFFKVWFVKLTLGKLNLDDPIQTQWLFLVLPFFMMGYGLNKTKIEEKKSYKWVEILLGISFLAYFLEIIILQIADWKNSTTLCLLTYPMVYFLVLFALKHPRVGNQMVARYASGISAFMYFGHILIVLIAQIIGISETPTYIMAVSLTFLFGVLIVKVNKPITNKLI